MKMETVVEEEVTCSIAVFEAENSYFFQMLIRNCEHGNGVFEMKWKRISKRIYQKFLKCGFFGNWKEIEDDKLFIFDICNGRFSLQVYLFEKGVDDEWVWFSITAKEATELIEKFGVASGS